MQEHAPFRISAQPTRVELVAKYFRGLGDETRLAILNLLEGEELAVTEIAQRIGVDQTSVSKHLQCLRWCGYVTTRRDHRTVYNRITDERVSQILRLAVLASAQLYDIYRTTRACQLAPHNRAITT